MMPVGCLAVNGNPLILCGLRICKAKQSQDRPGSLIHSSEQHQGGEGGFIWGHWGFCATSVKNVESGWQVRFSAYGRRREKARCALESLWNFWSFWSETHGDPCSNDREQATSSNCCLLGAFGAENCTQGVFIWLYGDNMASIGGGLGCFGELNKRIVGWKMGNKALVNHLEHRRARKQGQKLKKLKK